MIPLLLALLGATAQAGDVLVASEAQVFQLSGKGGLAMPSDVAVASDGRVFVADGVNNRVVVFDRAGAVRSELRTAAGKSLSRPTAVTIGADGRVWIADAGRKRVVVFDEALKVAQTLPLAEPWAQAVDITDLAVAGDALWLVDNDHHQVLRTSLSAGTWDAVGGAGNAFGRLHYPWHIALSAGGDAFITDVLNSRVQGYTASGRPLRPFGSHGAAVGQLFRPGGVAVRGDQVWVTDTTLGVIQVYTPTGRLVDVLRDASLEVLRLDSPVGIEIVADRLYVTELGANRVRAFDLSVVAGTPRVATTAAVMPGAGDTCTLCHLELEPALATGNALVAPPPHTKEAPYVSREVSCLSCHDGSVQDSRRSIWTRHGHPIDVAPSEGMVVPPELPLVGGKVVCRTCHAAHTLGGSGTQHRDALMMRVSAGASSALCASCHVGQPLQATPGSHPIGALDPTARRLPGLSDKVEGVNCVDCHMGRDSLRAGFSVEKESGCLSCHTGQDNKGDRHRGVRVDTDERRKAIAAVGGALGPNGQVVCMSCHSVHDANTPRERCVVCHADRKAAPNEPPRHGNLGCAACHGNHVVSGLPRPLQLATEHDPAGCLSCHRPDGQAPTQGERPGEVGHAIFAVEQPADQPPLTGCPSCHDVHAPGGLNETLCVSCHSERVAELARGGHGSATCLDCHPPHELVPEAPASANAVNPISRRCLACHATDATEAPDAPGVARFEHPARVFLDSGVRWDALSDLILYSPEGRAQTPDANGELTCASCHLTHGPDAEHAGTKRRIPNKHQPCAVCHGADALPYYLYFHRPEKRVPFGGHVE